MVSMDAFRWVLLLLGAGVVGLVFAFGRGWLPLRIDFSRFRKRKPERAEPTLRDIVIIDTSKPEFDQPAPAPGVSKSPHKSKVLPLEKDTKIVTVRILPQEGRKSFPGELLVLTLRGAGLKHGRFGIFHSIAGDDDERIRFSVASLIEPGSFDLSNLKDSEYPGISMFMVLPARENGVELFDHMMETARQITRVTGGRLLDEQGGALSLQRERYMREEIIEYLHQHGQIARDLYEEITDDNKDASAVG